MVLNCCCFLNKGSEYLHTFGCFGVAWNKYFGFIFLRRLCHKQNSRRIKREWIHSPMIFTITYCYVIPKLSLSSSMNYIWFRAKQQFVMLVFFSVFHERSLFSKNFTKFLHIEWYIYFSYWLRYYFFFKAMDDKVEVKIVFLIRI